MMKKKDFVPKFIFLVILIQYNTTSREIGMKCQEVLLRFIFGSLPKSRAIEIYLIKLHKILPIWQIRTMTTPFIREDHVNWFFFHFAFRSALIKLCKEISKKRTESEELKGIMVWLPLTLFRGCDTRKFFVLVLY